MLHASVFVYDTHVGQGSSLCPVAPSIGKKTIEHIFDAYVDKLPDHDFGGRTPVPTNAASSPESQVEPSVVHQEKGAEKAGDEPCSSSVPPGKFNNSTRISSTSGRLGREFSRGADAASDADGGYGGGSGAAGGAEEEANKAGRGWGDSDGGGGDGESTRSAFAWVSSHEGDAGPHTAVLGRNAEWAAVARDVRFRLASAWLSCDQVRRQRDERSGHTHVCRQDTDISFARPTKSFFCPRPTLVNSST